jgi:hypothetical protein
MALKTSLKRLIWTEKLNNPMGYAIFLLAGLASAYLIASSDNLGPAVILIGLPLGILLAVLCLMRPMFAIGVAMVGSMMIGFLPRMLGFMIPVGILVDVALYLAFGGVLLRQIANRGEDWPKLRQPFVYIYFAMVGYLILQAGNPNSTNIATYGLLIRRVLSIAALFIVVMCEFKSLRFFITFLKIWMVIAFVAGLYACKQEWFGMSQSELIAGPIIIAGGRYRIFSFMPDPTSFGIFMTISSLFCLGLVLGKFSWRVKLAATIMFVPMLLATAFSGTRTAYGILPAGIVIYILITLYRRQSILIAAGFALVAVFVLFAPIYTPVILRIRSSFLGGKDPSMNVRNVNRKSIQPYIWSHPFGGGMGMAGDRGPHNPGHRLAGFPPDSGYLQTALELGWIGLFIQCLFYGAALCTFITRYYQCRNPVLQSLILAYLMVLFAVAVAQYSQATEQIPTSLILYAGIAFVCRLKDFDPAAIQSARLLEQANGMVSQSPPNLTRNDYYQS